MKSESIVGSDEVDTCGWSAVTTMVEIGTASESLAHFGKNAISATPEISNAIAIEPVPFRPTRRKVSNLVATFANVPGFCYQFHLRDDGILVNDVEESAELIHFVQFACKGSCKIESESINMHLGNQVTKTVHYQSKHGRHVRIESVACACVIVIVTGILKSERVVHRFIEMSKGCCRFELICLSYVIVRDIDYDYNACAM